MCNAALCRHGFAPSLEQVTCSFEPPPPRSLSGGEKNKKKPPFCHLPIGYRCDFPIWKHRSGGSRWRRYPLIRQFAFWPRFGNKTLFYESEYWYAPAVFSCCDQVQEFFGTFWEPGFWDPKGEMEDARLLVDTNKGLHVVLTNK